MTVRSLASLVRLALLGGVLAHSTATAEESALGQPRRRFEPAGAHTHHPRPLLYDVRHLSLDLALDFDLKKVIGTARLTVAPTLDGLSKVVLDATAFEVAAARVDGRPAQFANDGSEITIDLLASPRAGSPVTVEVDYVARPRRGFFFMARANPDGSIARMAYSDGEPHDHRNWFHSYDFPNDRFTTEVRVTADAADQVLSNGTLVLPDGATFPPLAADGRTRTWHWRQDLPQVTYLMSVVVGRFDVDSSESHGRIPLSYWVPRGMGESTIRPTFGSTPGILAFFERETGVAYPWPKLAQVAVFGFPGGAMENTGAITYNLSYLHDEAADGEYSSDPTVSHEISHHWFGNLVTCRDWAHLWLNEGFATYMEALWMGERFGADRYLWEMEESREWYLWEDRSSYRRPIVHARFSRAEDLFDGHTYAKGAWVLHMLRWVLGGEAFQKSLRHYLEKHAWGNVTTRDLETAIREASGEDLSWFFDQWLEKGGHPEFAIEKEYLPEKGVLVVRVRQAQATDDLTPIFRMPVEIRVATHGEWTAHRVLLSEASHEFELPCASPPECVLFDHGHHVLKEVHDPKSVPELLYQLAHDDDVLGRKEAVEALAKSIADDEAVREALAGALRSDPAIEIRGLAAREIGGAIHGYRWQRWERDWGYEEPQAPVDDAVSEWAVRALAAGYEDPHPAVRTAAIRAALGFSGRPDAITVARSAAADERSPFTRASGLTVLARLGDPGAEEILTAALEVPSYQDIVRRSVLAGLESIGSERVFEVAARYLTPTRHESLREAAAEALARAGADDPYTLSLLFPYLDDPDRGFAANVVAHLAELSHLDRPRVVARLEAALAMDPTLEWKTTIEGALTTIQIQEAEDSK